MTTPPFAALENIEYDAAVDFFRAAPPHIKESFDIDCREVGGATCLHCRGLEPPMIFRRAVRLGVELAATEVSLDEVVRHMAARGGRFAIPVAPVAKPAELSAWLGARGFTPGYAWMKFSRSCDDLPGAAADLDLRIAIQDQADAFGRVVTGSFGLPDAMGPWVGALCRRPGWLCVLAFDGDAAVAAGAAFVRGEYAWLGFGGTLASHRKRGAQGALLARRLREVAALGARVAVTETGERLADQPNNSYRNILRAGFEERYLRQNFLSPA